MVCQIEEGGISISTAGELMAAPKNVLPACDIQAHEHKNHDNEWNSSSNRSSTRPNTEKTGPLVTNMGRLVE